MVQLTDSGWQLLVQILPVWDAILQAMDDLLVEEPGFRALLPAISSLEIAFKNASLAERIGSKLKAEVYQGK